MQRISMPSSRRGRRFAGWAGGWLVAGAAVTAVAQDAASRRFEEIAGDAARAVGSFRPVGDASLDAAASNLRSALLPLDALLGRSKSGADWRT